MAKTTIANALNKAKGLFNRGDFDDAVIVLTAILDTKPNHSEAHYYLGLIYLHLGKFNESYNHLLNAVENENNCLEYWHSAVDCLKASGNEYRIKELIAHAEKIGLSTVMRSSLNGIAQEELKFDDYFEKILNRLESKSKLVEVHKLIIKNEYPKAEAAALTLTLDPTCAPEAWKIITFLRQRAGDTNGALTSALEAARLSPRDTNARQNLAAVYMERGESGEAIEHIKLALDIDPDHVQLNYQLSSLYREAGLIPNQRKYLNTVLNLDQNFSEAHYDLGVSYYNECDYQTAIGHFSETIKLDARNFRAFNNLGLSHARLGSSADAARYFQQSLEIFPTFSPALINLGQHYLKERKYMLAKKYFHEAELNEGGIEAIFGLANAQEMLNDRENAARNYLRILKTDPTRSEVCINLGTISQMNGDYAQAESYYNRAIESGMNTPGLYINLAALCAAKGQYDEALDHIKKSQKFGNINLTASIIETYIDSKINNLLPTDANDLGLLRSESSEHPATEILWRDVDESLIATLESLDRIDLADVKDPSFGQTAGSDYSFFDIDNEEIQTLKRDLTQIIENRLRSKILIVDSFFSFFSQDAGVKKHNHLSSIDRLAGLDIRKYKFSLVYYIDVGDQSATHPGILNLFDPPEEILPERGLITLFPASRYHSSRYSGDANRIIVGVNFYAMRSTI